MKQNEIYKTIQNEMQLSNSIEDAFIVQYPNSTFNIKIILDTGKCVVLHRTHVSTETYKMLHNYLTVLNNILEEEMSFFETPLNEEELKDVTNERLGTWLVEIYKESVNLINSYTHADDDLSTYTYKDIEYLNLTYLIRHIDMSFKFYGLEEMYFILDSIYLKGTSFEEAKKLIIRKYEEEVRPKLL